MPEFRAYVALLILLSISSSAIPCGTSSRIALRCTRLLKKMASVQSGGDAPGGASAPSSSSTAASSVDYDPMCINMWSGPRCCSTSIMYSWAQRADCNGNVLDEPLYANYLKITGLPRPYVDLVRGSWRCGWKASARCQI